MPVCNYKMIFVRVLLVVALTAVSISGLPVINNKQPPQQLTEEQKTDALNDEPPVLQDLVRFDIVHQLLSFPCFSN